MRKFKRLFATLSITLCLSMIMGMGSVFATENVAENPEGYTVTQSTSEITNMEGLISLALAQAPKINAYLTEDTAEPKILTATQTLEKRTFTNGDTETDIAVSQIIPKQEMIDSLSTDVPKNTYFSDSVTGHTVGSTFYYTVRLNYVDLGTYYTYRADKLVTNIVKTSSTGVTCNSGTQMYIVQRNADKWQNIYYNNSSTPGTQQTFTLNSSHSGFYKGHSDGYVASEDGVFGQVVLNFSNGEEVKLQFLIWED